jgi:predicted Zn-dependent protease
LSVVRHRALPLAAAILTTVLAGCMGDRTGTAGAPPVIPAGAPRAVGFDRQDGRDHAKLVAAFGGEHRAPAAKALLTEITNRIVPATDRPGDGYEVTILDSPVVNAFALPNGRLYATRGLLALANDTAEIAAVLSHEIAHVTLQHASARTELELRSALVSRVVADVLGDPIAGATVLDRSRVTLAGFSRQQELEADQVGVRTLAKAGFDPYGAARFLTALDRAGGGKGKNGDMLSTHPSTPERIGLALTAARRIAAPGVGDRDRARYLAAIDGLAYGDDPADGVVRGRGFLHARLGVGFEAPEGIALENTAKAVLGVSGDGKRRLLFDALDADPGQTLEAILQGTWNEAVEAGTVESTTVNGAPAAIATARGKEWVFRLAALRIGGGTYRLVYATRTLNPDMERAFRQTLESIRALSPEERRAVRPLRLQVATAAPGDTVDAFAARMATADRRPERFLDLNGLDRGANLRPGEQYKLVVE